ncbi:MAG: chloride channel protein [Pseudomonadota bacterium]
MARSGDDLITEGVEEVVSAFRGGWRVIRHQGPSKVQFWFLALLVGSAAGAAALFFRKAISALQTTFYGTDDLHRLHSLAESLPWWWILILPIAGGLVVGLILHHFTPDARVRSVADVIEGAALRNGRVETRAGIASAFASLITLSTGGSSGREGPVVHMAGVMSTWVSDRIRADGITGRDLLGCAVAGAVSASFNAPIAGALFALEVVLRHFAVHAFAPITIAAVAGTVINRLEYGGVTQYVLPEPGTLVFYVELPAFLLLGLVSGLVAVAFMRGIFLAENLAGRFMAWTGWPRWMRPTIAGFLLGAIAIWFPHIIGVGYETTTLALIGALAWYEAATLAAVKCVAVAITLGGRMGGGAFSPSLMVGALVGLSFGYVATGIFPNVSGSETLYALAGMGAVAAAVLGAPISTTMIVFEMTGDWQTGLAVMTAVSLSTALASRMVDRSFFLTQLENRGIHLAAGPQIYLPEMFRISSVMLTLSHPKAPSDTVLKDLMSRGFAVDRQATLADAMEVFDDAETAYLPVTAVDRQSKTVQLVGVVFHVDVLKANIRALSATAAEEHS